MLPGIPGVHLSHQGGQSWEGQAHLKADFPCQRGVLGQLMTFMASSGPSSSCTNKHWLPLEATNSWEGFH